MKSVIFHDLLLVEIKFREIKTLKNEFIFDFRTKNVNFHLYMYEKEQILIPYSIIHNINKDEYCPVCNTKIGYIASLHSFTCPYFDSHIHSLFFALIKTTEFRFKYIHLN